MRHVAREYLTQLVAVVCLTCAVASCALADATETPTPTETPEPTWTPTPAPGCMACADPDEGAPPGYPEHSCFDNVEWNETSPCEAAAYTTEHFIPGGTCSSGCGGFYPTPTPTQTPAHSLIYYVYPTEGAGTTLSRAIAFFDDEAIAQSVATQSFGYSVESMPLWQGPTGLIRRRYYVMIREEPIHGMGTTQVYYRWYLDIVDGNNSNPDDLFVDPTPAAGTVIGKSDESMQLATEDADDQWANR